MVERFEELVRCRLADRYLELSAENPSISGHTAVALGGRVHRAFFVWWHTLVIESGWGSPEDYMEAIAERVQHMVAEKPVR